MLPLSDETRRTLHFPFVNSALIAVCVGAFVLQLYGGDAFTLQWSMVPQDLFAGRRLETLITSLFLHAGIAHIAGNMLFLWVFGPEIEDVMGPVRYLIFYLIGGVVANLAQAAVMPLSTVPNLGASGAIAAVMGAFLITYPRDQIRTVLIIGWFVRITFVPAALLVGLWFLIQVVSQIGSQTADVGGVAYLAHIGGLLFGAVAARFFEPRDRRRAEGLE